ncbi:MAG: glutamate-1-semialdehyde 2,1-aminomutase [Planctomycetes bacterium]|nr:glutamate-1-semialdehyde 2,1-aminomutase [Planctomycetota bacterium]
MDRGGLLLADFADDHGWALYIVPVPLLSNAEWFERARGAIPGGVNSPVRAYRAVGGTPPVIARGEGCRVRDIEGRDYIDYVCSWGALLHGHAHGPVVAAVREAAGRGTSFGAPHPGELELAEEVRARIPSIEQLRLVSSGTEAAMSAIRLSRAATDRPRIAVFEGCYHGHSDSCLAAAGSGLATLGLPLSPGVLPEVASRTTVLPYNDANRAREFLRAEGPSVAAVLVEPVAGNMGVVPPDPGFLETLREETRRAGSLLILDEVITGFRVARGGAQERFGIGPDLTLLGKILGGGLPAGGFGGPHRLLSLLAPEGPVYQAGTLSGNPLAVAAGLTTLREATSQAYAALERSATALESGLRAAAASASVPCTIQRCASLLTLFFTDRPVRNFQDAKGCSTGRFRAFFHAMLRKGILLPPSPYEAWFLSTAHREEAIRETISAAREAFQEAAAQPL